MPDREKVIKGLECHQDPHGCPECPYLAHETPLKDCDDDKLIADAIALLKKQEPVAPVEEWAWYDCYKCGACGKLWGTTYEIERWNFCPWCGRAVKWDATD